MAARKRTRLQSADGTVLGDIDPPNGTLDLVIGNKNADYLWKNWLYNLYIYAATINESFLTVEDWTTATLLGTWTVASSRTVQYYIDPYGVVHVRGAATGGTGDIFQLPTGYRPSQSAYFACYQGGVAEVAALTTGMVSVTVAGTGAVSLDPINFRV